MSPDPASEFKVVSDWQVVALSPSDPRATPLVDSTELRWSTAAQGSDKQDSIAVNEPPEIIGAPLLLLLGRERAVAGGLLSRYDRRTLSLSRTWLDLDQQQYGIPWRLIVGFETEARTRGYARAHLRLEAAQPHEVRLLSDLGFDHRIAGPPSDDGARIWLFEKPVESREAVDRRVRALGKHHFGAPGWMKDLLFGRRDNQPESAQGFVSHAEDVAAQNGWRLDSGYL